MLRKRLIPPPDLFPVRPWGIEVTGLRRELIDTIVGQGETAFALANGYLGVRGVGLEGQPAFERGTFLNGFFEHRPIVYGENAYGFPRVGQSMLNCPTGTLIRLYIDDEPFDISQAEVLAFHRALDFRSGILTRDVTWETALGRRFRLRSARLVSFHHRHLEAIDYELLPQSGDAEILIVSELVNRRPLPVETRDPRMAQGFVSRVLEPLGTAARGNRALLSYRTRSSGLTLGCGMDHVLETPSEHRTETAADDDRATYLVRAHAVDGEPIRIRKFVGYHYGPGVEPDEIRARVDWTLDRAVEDGFPAIAERQRVFVEGFWERADIEVEGGTTPEKQQVIRWNLFQLLQATARAEGHGVGARGLTGQTYEGHYFWDTEIYVLPFVIYTDPRAARQLLKHRYDMLDKARARARELNHRGATFPWRTIDGDEASAYYAAGTAQYHINADIIYALRKYVDVTGDRDFLNDYGAEMLVETARFWVDLGNYRHSPTTQFCINGVTGPDEYTAVVNNNYFTNIMAQENLRFAVATVRTLEQAEPGKFARLVEKTGLDPGEPDAWAEAADAMYLPYDETRGIHPQDDSFLDKPRWDFEGTPAEHYPLLLHYHPLNLYRHQVIKQADTLLAMFLLSDRFSVEEKKRNFDYYDPLTTHDSSLSVCIQSILAAEIGYAEKAREYFNFAAAMDLADVGGNMKHGAHIASIGGTWLALVCGFGGLRDGAGVIRFNPRLPPKWQRLRFRLTVRGSRFVVDIRPDKTVYELRSGPGLTLEHEGQEVALTPDQPHVERGNGGRERA